MDTTTYTTLRRTRHVLHMMDKVQSGHLVEVWMETVDYQDEGQDHLNLETPQDFLRRVASAEPGTIENGHEYIILDDSVVQDDRGTHVFHSLKAERWVASMALDFTRA